ncbi:MAG: hypothetical protein MI864_12385 [Pseudomonadales bacterium]|nr:hypothetical protein [Pseudomonadales bacterium]
MITKVIFGILAFLIAFVPLVTYVLHLYQKAQLQRARKISDLTQRYQALNKIISGTPPQYLSQELAISTIRDSIQFLEALLKVVPKDQRVINSLALKRDLLGQTEHDYTHEQITLGSINAARAVQARLLALRNIISVKRNRGQLDKEKAREYIEFLSWQAIRCITDVLIARAEKLMEDKNLRLALFTYQSIVTEFQKMPDNDQAKRAIERSQERIQTIRKEMEKVVEEQLKKQKDKTKSDMREAWEQTFA